MNFLVFGARKSMDTRGDLLLILRLFGGCFSCSVVVGGGQGDLLIILVLLS